MDLYDQNFQLIQMKKMKELIEKCWENLPSNRPSFDEIYSELSVNYKEYTFNCNEGDIEDYIDLLEESDQKSVSAIMSSDNQNIWCLYSRELALKLTF